MNRARRDEAAVAGAIAFVVVVMAPTAIAAIQGLSVPWWFVITYWGFGYLLGRKVCRYVIWQYYKQDNA